MASLAVAGGAADDAATVVDGEGEERRLEREAIDAFGGVVERCGGFSLEGADEDGAKRLKRGLMLHKVVSLKFPKTKVEDVQTMAREWIQGMLESTYPLEKKASSDRFRREGDADLAASLAACYDAAAAWTSARLVPALESALGPEQRSSPPVAAAEDKGGGAVDEADAKRMLQAALASGKAQFDEVVGDCPAPEAVALTVDLWESLNWRRGALRFYVATVECGLGPKDETPAPDVLRARAAARAPDLEVGVRALCAMLDARGGDAFAGSVPRRDARSAVSYGVYGTTHLLGLAYAGELSYLRFLVGDDAAPAWRSRALKLIHRYIYVVEVLMDGCGWSVARPKELVALLGGQAHLEATLRVEWADAPKKVAGELRRLALADPPRDVADDDEQQPRAPPANDAPAKDAPRAKKKKGGKKGRG